MSEEKLSIAAMHRIIKKSGAERVSDSACEELAKVLEEVGVKLGGDALDFAMHAGRKTVKARDVKAATKHIGERLDGYESISYLH